MFTNKQFIFQEIQLNYKLILEVRKNITSTKKKNYNFSIALLKKFNLMRCGDDECYDKFC